MRYTKNQLEFMIQKAVAQRVRNRRFRSCLLFTSCVTAALLFGTYYPDNVKSGIAKAGEYANLGWLQTKTFLASLFS